MKMRRMARVAVRRSARVLYTALRKARKRLNIHEPTPNRPPGGRRVRLLQFSSFFSSAPSPAKALWVAAGAEFGLSLP